MSVPQFGVWDQKSGGSPDCAKVPPQARADKKRHKHDIARRNLGNEQELNKHTEVSSKVRNTCFLSLKTNFLLVIFNCVMITSSKS